MKILRLSALPAVVTLALFGAPLAPSGLTFTCSDGLTTSPCATGLVDFTGTGYHNHTRVVVLAPNGEVMDEGFYQAPDGVLSFTQGLSFPGTYTIVVSRKGGKDILQTLEITTVNPTQ